MASPEAMAIPSNPSHSPATAISAHSAVRTSGQGATSARIGAKKKPVPMYHEDPARSDLSTKRSHRGIGGGGAVAGDWTSFMNPTMPLCAPAGNYF